MILTVKCDHGERSLEYADTDSAKRLSYMLRDLWMACPQCAFDARGVLDQGANDAQGV